MPSGKSSSLPNLNRLCFGSVLGGRVIECGKLHQKLTTYSEGLRLSKHKCSCGIVFCLRSVPAESCLSLIRL